MSDGARITKLPAWTRSMIADLERRAADAEEELRLRREAQPESDVWLEHGFKREERQYIPEPFGNRGMHTVIVFRLPSDETAPRAESTISVRIKDDGLEISATGYPHALSIRAQASNVMHVKAVR